METKTFTIPQWRKACQVLVQFHLDSLSLEKRLAISCIEIANILDITENDVECALQTLKQDWN